MVFHYVNNFFSLFMKYIDISFTTYAIRNNLHIGPAHCDTRYTFQFYDQYNINDEWKNT